MSPLIGRNALARQLKDSLMAQFLQERLNRLYTHRHVAQSRHMHVPNRSLKGFTPATAGTDDHLFD